MAATGTYIDQEDIEDHFGANNIAAWSQRDNTVAAADETAIQLAIDTAEQTVEDRFADGAYAIPFVATGTRSLVKVKEWCSKLAGVWLYENRGLRDAEETGNKLTAMKDAVNHEMALYLSMQMKMAATRATPGAPSGPAVAI